MTTIEKKESNQLAEMVWNDSREVLTLKFFDGIEEKFDTRLTSTGVHLDAKVYGFHVKINRLGAISATEFPSRKARAEEYRRRLREFRDHCYTGADSWDAPRKASGPRVTEADLLEILEAFKPGAGQVLLTGSLKVHEGDLKAATNQWLATKECATIWANIQAARRAEAAKGMESADDIVAKMMAAAGA